MNLTCTICFGSPQRGESSDCGRELEVVEYVLRLGPHFTVSGTFEVIFIGRDVLNEPLPPLSLPVPTSLVLAGVSSVVGWHSASRRERVNHIPRLTVLGMPHSFRETPGAIVDSLIPQSALED